MERKLDVSSQVFHSASHCRAPLRGSDGKRLRWWQRRTKRSQQRRDGDRPSYERGWRYERSCGASGAHPRKPGLQESNRMGQSQYPRVSRARRSLVRAHQERSIYVHGGSERSRLSPRRRCCERCRWEHDKLDEQLIGHDDKHASPSSQCASPDQHVSARKDACWYALSGNSKREAGLRVRLSNVLRSSA